MEYVHPSAKQGYNNEAISHYEEGRPRYPVEVIRAVLNGLNSFPNESGAKNDTPFRILELGAGTGKFTRDLIPELQGKNVELIVSEPLPAMCEKLKEIVADNAKVLQCAAQEIPIENDSIDAVIAVQSFHWFSDKQSTNEIARVMRRGSTMALMWLMCDKSYSWVAQQDDIIEPYYEIMNTPTQPSGQWKLDVQNSELFSIREEIKKDASVQTVNMGILIERLLSISVISVQTSQKKKKIEEEYRNVLLNHPDLKGKQTFPFPCVAEICWCDKI